MKKLWSFNTVYCHIVIENARCIMLMVVNNLIQSVQNKTVVSKTDSVVITKQAFTRLNISTSLLHRLPVLLTLYFYAM
jgi:hypothetical protein